MSQSTTAEPPADTKPKTMPVGELIEVPPSKLIPTPDNTRKFRADAAFDSLVESIRTTGIFQPLIARKMKGDKFDLRAGERRLRAALKLKLSLVPVIIRDWDDATALKITVLENLERDDLTVIERAASIKMFYDRDMTTADIAAELGRSPGWVARQAQLLSLTGDWQKAIARGDEHWAGRWPVASLQLIAALSSDNQARVFKQFGGHDKDWSSHGMRDLQVGKPGDIARWIANNVTRELKHAQWDLDDGTLVPTAGACSACPKRTKATPFLWDELEDAKSVGAGDRCLEGSCWNRKATMFTQLNLQARVDALKPTGKKLLVVKAHEASKPAMAAAKKLKLKTVTEYHVTTCKASDKGATPAVRVSSNGIGAKLIYVRTKPGSDSGSRKSGTSATKTTRELRADLKQRRQAAAANEWFDYIGKKGKSLAATMAEKMNDSQLLTGMTVFVPLDSGMSSSDFRKALFALHNAKERARLRTTAAMHILAGIADMDAMYRCKDIAVLIARIETNFLPSGIIEEKSRIAAQLIDATAKMPEPAGWKERDKAGGGKAKKTTAKAKKTPAKKAKKRKTSKAKK